MGEIVCHLSIVPGSGKHTLTFHSSLRPVLSTWANYTVDSLPDPGNQLCTDDFEGPSPHNVNLAAKVAMTLASILSCLQYELSFTFHLTLLGYCGLGCILLFAENGWEQRGCRLL